MNARSIGVSLLVLGACLLGAAPSSAAPAQPAWRLDTFALPTSFTPGTTGSTEAGPAYFIAVTNVGAAPTSAPTTVTDVIPEGVVPIQVESGSNDNTLPNPSCSITVATSTVNCTEPASMRPGVALQIVVAVEVVGSAPLALENLTTVEGGGAAPLTQTTPSSISSQPASFDFLAARAGLDAPLTEADGSPATRAGSHPFQLSINLGFPTKRSSTGNTLISAGHLRDTVVELPPGEIIDPSATPVLCTEAQLIAAGCPDASQIGTASVLSVPTSIGLVMTPLYNMVPPVGKASSFAFDATGVGIYAHIFGSVRTDGDFGLNGSAEEILALSAHPVFGARLDFWGNPSAKVHDLLRGHCLYERGANFCQSPEKSGALLTTSVRCPGQPDVTIGRADSWEETQAGKQASYESSSLSGNPVSLSGCNLLDFHPQISVQPTTNLADSPSGLDVELHQPQGTSGDEPLESLATAILRDATVTLPAGMSVNPSQADGLQACSVAQIGLTSATGQSPIHFDKSPAACPDAAKLGTLEATSPLLGETDESGTKIQRDPETHAVIPRPLHGSIYLAQPLDNPFKSLIAIYLVIEDARTGTVTKLAGQVIPDPSTGQITTRFEENPQLPLEDVGLHFFGGARGSLITPSDCATHTSTSDLTAWSAPETLDAEPTSSFDTTTVPGGGACPSTPQAAANTPAFTAGTISPQAAAYSPFTFKLSREDGSARLTGFDTLLPPGLTGKLAGIPACGDAQIAQAQSRSGLEEGAIERDNPSCPAASALGTVTVAAGAGPTPYYTKGVDYLAGPYKGAPLSLAVITPAIAGPFDLGTVVVRAALRVDPDTAQIHAVSDPFPTILHGIPLDLRSVVAKLDRPNFILNPTSCDPMAITGSATSVFSQNAPLTAAFQVGGCPALPFKPRLSLQLKGKTKRTSHPTLIADLTAKPGEANIARAQVTLPGAAFLDNAHIGTVCTRVQFAAKSCPAASVYGKVSATTPLLDYTLTGNVYLRSSSHQLPDLIADLNGPSNQPIEIALAGKTDSVKGALRNTFEAVPDQPVSKFHLELFGGGKGLIILSSGLCKSPKATVDLDGQNGKVYDTEPVVKTSCKKPRKKGGGGKKKHRPGRGSAR